MCACACVCLYVCVRGVVYVSVCKGGVVGRESWGYSDTAGGVVGSFSGSLTPSLTESEAQPTNRLSHS